jgi:hypothetical protein
MVQIRIGDHPIDLMVDTSAGHSVVTQSVGSLSQKHAAIIGVTGVQAHFSFLVSKQRTLGSHEIRNEFLYLPDCPVGLMGRDLLCKQRAQITFDLDGMAVERI